jgi:hypothetical protein
MSALANGGDTPFGGPTLGDAGTCGAEMGSMPDSGHLTSTRGYGDADGTKHSWQHGRSWRNRTSERRGARQVSFATPAGRVSVQPLEPHEASGLSRFGPAELGGASNESGWLIYSAGRLQ